MKTPATKLERAVLRIMRQNADVKGGYTLTDVFRDLQHGGCASGTITGMIYYTETTAFFRTHKADINALLAEAIDNSGESTSTIIPLWTDADPLALEAENQNALAWWGFETAAWNLFGDD